MKLLRAAAILTIFEAAAAFAGVTATETASKSGFNLFNPTPRELMREFNTDRPDETESPYTVDAGHFQLEMDFFRFTSDRHTTDGSRAEVWNFAPINIKAGLFNNVDLQVILDNYGNQRTVTNGVVSHASGFGDITTRLKINLWGNDGGSTAFGIMPFVKLPLSKSSLRNGRTEGGVILPLTVALPGGWSVALMTEADFVHNDDGGYDTEWVNSASFSHDITKKLGGYIEFFTVVGDAADFDWKGQVDVGLTYVVVDNVQLDAGCDFGVTRSAPDFQPFAGISVRF